MSEAGRRDELGDEFREKADKQRQQFVNWVAIASAGGIALIVGFAQQNQAAIYILRPSLVAWLERISTELNRRGIPK
uniref:hypothetical protein n=1 Tax=Sphingomonas elodea TaxID=179878 RepID=UPI000263163B